MKGLKTEDMHQVERACVLQCGIANRGPNDYSDSEGESGETVSTLDSFKPSNSDLSTDTDSSEISNNNI